MTDDDKQARLAAALRDNLRRRKAQARGATPTAAPVATDRDADDPTVGDDQPLK